MIHFGRFSGYNLSFLDNSSLHRHTIPAPTPVRNLKNRIKFTLQRFYSNPKSLELKPILITTPIFYVNDKPHIGHLYSVLLADSLARWHRILGHPTLFTTGTDEHGLKVQQAANTKEMDVIKFCDSVSESFRNLWDRTNISYDDYIRTTEKRHYDCVEYFWKKMVSNDDIYISEFEGWYSISDEVFLTELQVTDELNEQGEPTGQKISIENGSCVVRLRESNYHFKLNKYRKKLLDWIEETHPIYPSSREKYVISDIMNQTKDLSVSRLKSKINWGITVPNDADHIVYVWCDALANYLTACNYPNWNEEQKKFWPPSYHIIGKDISKFHSIFWPAFLMSAGLELPKQIVSHGHWTHEKKKISKSKGNVVDPHKIIDTNGVDPVRFFLLKAGGLAEDGDFSETELQNIVSAFLANNFGNLISRCTSKSLNPTKEWPILSLNFLTTQEMEYINMIAELPDTVDILYKKAEFPKAIKKIFEFLDTINIYFSEVQPWKLIPKSSKLDGLQISEENLKKLGNTIYIALESIRICGLLLQPIIPTLSENILDHIGIPKDHRNPLEYRFGYNYKENGLKKLIPVEENFLLLDEREKKSIKLQKKKLNKENIN